MDGKSIQRSYTYYHLLKLQTSEVYIVLERPSDVTAIAQSSSSIG
jgi:hypothetical protein